MKSAQSMVVALAASTILAGPMWAGILVPGSYTATPGEGQAQGGTFNYFDDTGGQLTDGIVGADNWAADLGNGNAYEWVGYLNANPTFVFHFAPGTHFGTAEFHVNNFGSGGVGLFGTATIDFSNDGVSYSGATIFSPSGAQNADPSAQWVVIPVNGTGEYLRATFTDGVQPWQFYSEARFTDVAVPEPSEWAAIMAAGLAGFALWRRRKA